MEPIRQNLDDRARRFHRDELRDARAAALNDAEGFLPVVRALERLGRYLNPGANGLGQLSTVLHTIAKASPYYDVSGSYHIKFDVLLELVRTGRNDALHEGAFARHLTRHTVELALRIEEGLMARMRRIADYMVRSPVIAEPWQLIGFARQQMLLNSFSYLPIQRRGRWRLLSDWAIARYLAAHSRPKVALSTRIGQALDRKELDLVKCQVVSPENSISEVLPRLTGKPAVVVEDDQLVGIVTPFDLL